MHRDFGEILALLTLSLVACGLVVAAIYGVYARPKTATAKERQGHVISGFRLAGGTLVGFVLVGALVDGVGVAFFGVKHDPAPLTYSSRVVGLVVVAISLTGIVISVQRWAKYLGGWIGYGALNGLLMASSGHLLNHPAIPVRRSFALTMTAIAIVSALACLRFTESYRLRLADKIAVIGWVVCFAVAANAEKYGLQAITIAGLGLLLAWLQHTFGSRLKRHQRSSRFTGKAV